MSPAPAKNPRIPHYWLSVIGCWLLAVGCLSAFAQSSTGGSVAGVISGISGNHFRAIVTLRNTDTGEQSQALSDAGGNFRFAELPPGNYAVRINAPGAAPWYAYNVTVEVGRVTLLAPRLTVAWIDPRPSKNEIHAPETDLTPAVVGNVDQNFLSSLPSSANHWSAFAALAAGASPDAADPSTLSFRGLSPTLNGIALDGADNTLAFHARERGTGTTGGSGYSTPQSAISQFQVASSNYSAQYGRAAGGIINSITKSGSNTLHIEASLYDRNAAWGAMNAWTRVMQSEPAGTTITSTGEPVLYLNGNPITYIDTPYRAPDQRYHADIDAGGPIRRDKLFWFFAAEYSYRNFPAVARANEPETFFAAPSAQTIQTLGARLITSTNPVLTNNCPYSANDPNAQPLCAYGFVLNQLNGILGSLPRTARQSIFFPKIDWRVNNRIHLTGQYNFMRRNSPNGLLTGASETYGIGSFGNSNSSENAALARLEYFFTPALLNNVRYQYSRDLLSQLAATPTPAGPASFEQQFATNTYGHAPQISIDRSAGFTLGTLSSQSKSEYPLETRQQFVDSVTWIRGRHAFRFGYDYNHVTDAIDGLNGGNGEYSYSSLANFIADYLAPNSCDSTTTAAGSYPCYSSFRQTLGYPSWTFSTADYAAFVADDWKLTPRFTISLGLRYDYERLPNTNRLLVNPGIPQTATLPHDRNNFGPRAGFAFALTRSGHTILRGGYGLYYGRISNATVFSALTSTGSAHSARTYFYRPTDIGAPPFPYVFADNETPYINPNAPDHFSSAPNAAYFDKRFQNPQIDQAELSLEQQLGRRTTVTLTAMASFGRELPQFLDRNIDLTAAATVNYSLDFTTNPGHLGPLKSNFTVPFYYAHVNNNYGSITDIISETNSSYQGAVLRLTRRTRRNIDLNVAYTYAHAVDDNQNEATFANFNNVYDPANLRLEHGTSNFDIRQRASGGIVAHTPWRFNGFGGSLVNGYMLSAYGEWRTGLPYTMRTMGSIPTPLCSSYDWLTAGGTNGGSACLNAYTASGGIITDGPRPVPGIGASLNGSGGEDLVPQIGRNTFRYPGAMGLDARIGKRTSITERIAIEVFAEAFNVLNHQNVTNIQTVGYGVENESASSTSPYADTVNLAYMSGLKTYTTTLANGTTQTQLIGSPTAPFGDTTATNNNAVYHARQIQLGCRIYF